MHEIASLIREFPFGSFLIITGLIAGLFGVAHAIIDRNKPVCDCECCNLDDEDDCEEDEEDDGEP